MKFGAIALAMVAAVPSFAAIEGVVMNQTTGKPQPGVELTLTKFGEGGMQVAAKAKSDGSGKFKLDGDAASAHLLRATYGDVTYNTQLPPGSAAQAITLSVYDSLAKVSAAEVTQHMVLLESDGKELVVRETLVYANDSKTTWYDAKAGTARVYIPAVAGENKMARVIAPGGMPVDRELKNAGKDVWSVDYPVKPGGETRFDFSYKLAVKEPVEFASRILHDGGSVRLVVPPGMTVQGDGLKQVGIEPSTRAAIYDITKKEYRLTLAGAGGLRDVQPTERAEDEGPSIQPITPPGYERQWKWVLGLALAILALGFYAQFMKSAPPAGGKR
jgi:hypothetical protein